MPHVAIQISQIVSSPFLRGIASYSVSEVAAKLSRLVAVVAMARVLTPAQIGIVAAAIAIAEILKAFTENGIIQKVIAAPDAQLDVVCNTAFRLNIFWVTGLLLIQNSVALTVWHYFGQAEAAMIIALMSIEYIFMPHGAVNCALAMREGRMSGTAAVAGAQNVLANLFLALLILFWPSPLAIAASRIATAPLWLLGMRHLRPWTQNKKIASTGIHSFARFGTPVLGVELLKALRLHSDKLIIGALLGPEILGIYYFAINAGLGIANSFSTAFSIVLYPHLCGAVNREKALKDALFGTLAVLTPIILIQSMAAPIYVPIIFGEQWGAVSEYVAILCLAALPGVVWAAAAQDLRARGRPDLELAYAALITATTTTAIIIAAPYGLSTLVIAVLASTTISQLTASWFSTGRSLFQHPTQL